MGTKDAQGWTRVRETSPASLLVVAIVIVAMGGCGGREEMPEIIGEINNEYLTTDEFMHQMKVRGGQDLAGKAREEFKRWLVAELVDRKLLLQEARRRGVRSSREEVRARIGEAGAKGWEDAEKAQVLAVEDDLWEQRQIEELLRRGQRALEQPTRREAKAYIAAHPGEFSHPRQIRLRQIVVHSAAMADKAKSMLDGGETIEETARRLGGVPRVNVVQSAWVGKGEIPDEVWAAVADAPRCKVRGPVTTEYGFHFAQVLGSRDAGSMPAKDAEAVAKKRLLEAKRAVVLKAWLEKLRGAADIRVDEAAVSRL